MNQNNHSNPKDSFDASAITADAWLHTRETVTLLYLSICQIETTIDESNESVQQLTDTFTRLAKQTLTAPKHSDTNLPIWSNEEMRGSINEAITAFQFYDRISQRLDHVARGLEKLTDVFNDTRKLNDPDCWETIKREVKSSYSMEGERAMFDEIINGASVQEALQRYKSLLAKTHAQQRKDDIELF